MTAVDDAPAVPTVVTWYKPEPVASTTKCFCQARSVGRTCYYDGLQLVYRYQCGDHLPAVGARFEYEVGAQAVVP